MRQYCRFLSKDLIASLDGKLGRSEKVIYEILRIYFVITSKKYDVNTRKKIIVHMETVVNGYLSDGDTLTYTKLFQKLDCNNKEGNIFVASIMYTKINENLEQFMQSSVKYKKHFPNEPYFKQSMIEFNNALSHLYNFYCNSVEFEANASRANTHLHRGTLDFYKTLIRDKKHGLTVSQKNTLIAIRLEESGTRGNDIECALVTVKQDLPSKYRDFITLIGYE